MLCGLLRREWRRGEWVVEMMMIKIHPSITSTTPGANRLTRLAAIARLRDLPGLPVIDLRDPIGPQLAAPRGILTVLVQSVEPLHLGAAHEIGRLRALRTAAAGEGAQVAVGEVVVHFGGRAEVADGEVPGAFEAVELARAFGGDGGEEGFEVCGGFAVVVGETAFAVVLRAVGFGG